MEQQDEFLRALEEKAVESKISSVDLKDHFDNNGIFLRDNCYDQLAGYFDLDRNGNIYIPNFCQYLRS